MSKGLRIDPDYTEDMVGFALAGHLAVLNFPYLDFSIEPFSRHDERWLGADAVLHGATGFRPFYMQFKRPFAYPEHSTAAVVRDITNLNVSASPRVLYFGLQPLGSGHQHLQHNVLHRLHRRLRRWGLGDAAYVCPLFTERSTYVWHMHIAALMRWPTSQAVGRSPVVVRAQDVRYILPNVPILSAHASIPPHRVAPDHNHKYSFLPDGGSVCYHSPEIVLEKAQTLGDFLASVVGDGPKDEQFVNSKNSRKLLSDLVSSAEIDAPNDILDADTDVKSWLNWGSFLRTTYGIHQYAFVKWSEREVK